MKTWKAIISGLALSATLLGLNTLQAQDAAASPNRPPGITGQRGAGRGATLEQRAERRQQMRASVNHLRERKARGAITRTEKAWLDRAEQRGGRCINGVPRGPRGGFGPDNARAQGQGRGRRGGMGGGGRGMGGGGAGGNNPNCPLLNPPNSN